MRGLKDKRILITGEQAGLVLGQPNGFLRKGRASMCLTAIKPHVSSLKKICRLCMDIASWMPPTPSRLSALSASWMALRMTWTCLSTMPVSASAIPTGLLRNVSKEKFTLTAAY